MFAEIGIGERGEAFLCGLVEPDGHVWVRAEASAVGDIVIPPEHTSVWPKAGNAERDDNYADALLVGFFDEPADAFFGLGSPAGPVFAQRFGSDIDEVAEGAQQFGSALHVGEPAFVFFVVARAVSEDEDALVRWIEAE